jgi:hypothetical protein
MLLKAIIHIHIKELERYVEMGAEVMRQEEEPVRGMEESLNGFTKLSKHRFLFNRE